MTRSSELPEPYRVAVIQFEPALFETTRNIKRLVELTEEAAGNGAKLIVHPEMATTGYCWASRAEISPHVEPIPGPTTEHFAEIAARHGCHIVIGLPEIEPETGIYYNSAALLGPDSLVGVYRKTHSYISEPKWAKDGDLGIPVFDTELGRIAITICMDAAFPESARVPALNGADVICFPTNWLSENCPSPTWMARALENGVYVLAANRYGLERGVQFSGGSCVIDPDGTIQASQSTGDEVVYGIVDLARARDKRWSGLASEEKLIDRRPELYGSITLSPYRWQDQDFYGLYGLNPLPVGKKSRIVACQMTPIAGETDGNLSRIAEFAAEHAGTDLIVFPELVTTGPVDSLEVARVAGDSHGLVLARLAAIAAGHGVHLIAGLVEQSGDHYFNSAVLVGPNGVVGSYRKTHLTDSDRIWATPGDELKTFNIPAGRVGMLIGYDALFPETSTCLALEGADLIACPSLLDGPRVIPLGEHETHFHLWRERAKETSTMIVFANGASPSMGLSAISGAAAEPDPIPFVEIKGDDEGSAELELDTTNLETRYKTNPVRAKDLVAMRMPIWYDAIQRPSQPRQQHQNIDLLASRTTAD